MKYLHRIAMLIRLERWTDEPTLRIHDRRVRTNTDTEATLSVDESNDVIRSQ
jgi:hypothetical protein